MASEGRVLVVVESPAKCRTIQKYLGPSYVVQASLGHVRDLPAKGKRGGRWEELPGLDPENGWAARWEVLDGKRDTVARLKKLAGRTRVVVLATDQDREGEAIARHLCELLGGRRERFRRVTFNEITRSAIERAFARPRRIDGRLVDAQNARRFLDRVVGYRVSPLLGRRLGAGLSAGRVQSPALRLVVEREREIQAFKPTAYWEVVVAARSSEGDLVEFEVVDGDTSGATAREGGDRALRFLEEAASRVVERVRAAGRVVVGSVRSAEEVRKPPAPFTTWVSSTRPTSRGGTRGCGSACRACGAPGPWSSGRTGSSVRCRARSRSPGAGRGWRRRGAGHRRAVDPAGRRGAVLLQIGGYVSF